MKLNFKLIDQKRKNIGFSSQRAFSIACGIPYGSYMDYLQKGTQPWRKEIKIILERILRVLNKAIQEKIKDKKEELMLLKEFEEKDFIIN